MSDGEVDVVRKSIEAFNRRDVDGFLELCDRAVEWFPALSGGVEGGSYRGLDGIRAYFDDLRDTWELFEFDPAEYRELGERVLVLGHVRTQGRGGGVSLDQSIALLYELHAGKLLRVRSFLSQEEAIGAAEQEGVWDVS